MNSLIIFLALLKNSECVVKSHDAKNDFFDPSFSLSSCTSKGRIQESCHMLCNWDGSCREVVETRKCLCNGYLKTNLLSTAYKDGNVVGANEGSGHLRTCEIMPMRCSQCRIAGQAKTANSWKFSRDSCLWISPHPDNAGVEILIPSPSQSTVTQIVTPVTTSPMQSTSTTEVATDHVEPSTLPSDTSGNISLTNTNCQFRGLIQETCEMQCDWDGSCNESISTTKCRCTSFQGTILAKQTLFVNGTIQGNNMGSGILATCNILPLRCTSCKQGGEASLGKSWRSQQKVCMWGSPINEGASLIIAPSNKN